MGCVHHPVRLPSAPCGTLCRSSAFNARQIVRSTERDGGLWRAAIESKAVIPSSNISLDYSDLAKVLTLIGALTCYSWVCFEQAKADQSELNTWAPGSIVGLIDRNKSPGNSSCALQAFDGHRPSRRYMPYRDQLILQRHPR